MTDYNIGDMITITDKRNRKYTGEVTEIEICYIRIKDENNNKVTFHWNEMEEISL